MSGLPVLPEIDLDPLFPPRPDQEPDPDLPVRPPRPPPNMAQPVPTTAPTSAQTTPAPTTRPTTAPPVPSTSAPSSVVPTTSVPPSSSSSLPPSSSSSRPPSSSTTTTSVAPSTTSTVPPVVTPTTPPPSTSSSSSTVLTITSTVPRPSLITSVNPSSRSGTAAAAASQTSEGKGGVGGSGLSIGALAGIIIGGVAAIAVVAFLVTHSLRKKARNRRTANRSSMFEPWPAPAPVAMEDEPYEKSRYDAPSQSYPMQDQSYDPYVNAQQQAYHAESQPLAYPQQGYAPGPGGPEVGGYNYQPEYAHPPPGQGYAQYPPNGPGAMAPYGAPAAGMVAAAATMSQGHESSMGLVDGMMVRVKVGFVRTLEDELAITPGQQLYLHNQYDDGWSLCEDQNQNRGVVPVSCLEPWTEQHRQSAHLDPNQGMGMQRSNTAESLTNTSQRRSSLYQAQQGGNRMSQGNMMGVPMQGPGQGQGHF